MQSVFTTDLKCGKCVSKITPCLNEIALGNWRVDTQDPRKLLFVEHAEGSAAVANIQACLSAAGFVASPIADLTTPAGESAVAEKNASAFRLANYKPLGLVFLYVAGLTTWFEVQAGSFELPRAMSTFMGAFFLAFAFFKLLDVQAFATAFSSYDIVAAKSRRYALTYPFIEFGLGLAFLFRIIPQLTSLVTIAIMSIGLVGVLRALRKKQAIQCACLGTAFNLPMSVVTVIENGVMIVMSAVMLFQNAS